MNLTERVLKNMGLGGESTKKLENASDQTQEEKDLAEFVKSKTEEARSYGSRTASEGVWMTNIAALMGYSGVSFNTQTRQWNGTTANPFARGRNNSSPLTVNKLLPRAQNRLARLCKSPPKYDVRPDSTSPDDKDAARFNSQVLEHMIEKQRVTAKRIDLYQWAQQCGHAYIKVSYDPTLGDLITDPITGETINEGDVRVDVRSAFEVFPDPLAKNIDECSYLIEAKVRKLDYFKTQFPEKGGLVKEEAAWLLSAQYEQRINTMQPNYSNGVGITAALMKNAAIELSYYERPSIKFPQGRLIITASGVLLHTGDLPVGKIPFRLFTDIKVSGKYYGEAVLTHARPVQEQYNRVVRIRAKWTNVLAAGKYIAAKGHGLQPEALNDQTGEVVEYTPVPNAGPPQAMTIPMIPQYLYQEEDRLDRQMDDIFGINETSRGVQSSANMPALSMQILQESDETRLGIQTEDNEHQWAMVYQLMLAYGQKFYKTERKLKYTSKGQFKVKTFTGDDIKGSLDVTVIRGSTLPGNLPIKRQELVNSYQLGLLGPVGDPETLQKLLEGMEYGDVQNVWADMALDQDQINEALKSIEMEGVILPVDEFDNHKLAIKEIERYRKSDKFKALDMMKQQQVIQLREIHLNFLIKLAGAPTEEQLAEQMTAPMDPSVMGPGPTPMTALPPEISQ